MSAALGLLALSLRWCYWRLRVTWAERPDYPCNPLGRFFVALWLRPLDLFGWLRPVGKAVAARPVPFASPLGQIGAPYWLAQLGRGAQSGGLGAQSSLGGLPLGAFRVPAQQQQAQQRDGLLNAFWARGMDAGSVQLGRGVRELLDQQQRVAALYAADPSVAEEYMRSLAAGAEG